MRLTRSLFWLAVVGSLTGAMLVGPIALASNSGLIGTWHKPNATQGNIFYWIDEPVGGVYPVLAYGDVTTAPTCGDEGPILLSGFAHETDTTNVFAVTFGPYWCPDNGDGVQVDPLGLGVLERVLTYDPVTETLGGGIGSTLCVATRVEGLDDANEAIEEIAEGEYPVPSSGPGCP